MFILPHAWRRQADSREPFKRSSWNRKCLVCNYLILCFSNKTLEAAVHLVLCSLFWAWWCLVHGQIRSDQISRSVVSDSLRPHESQHARPPCLSPIPRVHWDPRPSSQWCHPAISSSVVPFSSCPQYSAIKKNAFESILMSRQSGDPLVQVRLALRFLWKEWC